MFDDFGHALLALVISVIAATIMQLVIRIKAIEKLKEDGLISTILGCIGILTILAVMICILVCILTFVDGLDRIMSGL